MKLLTVDVSTCGLVTPWFPDGYRFCLTYSTYDSDVKITIESYRDKRKAVETAISTHLPKDLVGFVRDMFIGNCYHS